MPISFGDEFPVRLKHMRAYRNLTQQVLAELAGVSRRRLAGYESGESLPKRSTLLSLARVLAVDPGWLSGAPEQFPERANYNREIISEPRVRAKPVYISGELAKKLEERARKNGWSLNSEVSRRLAESLELVGFRDNASEELSDAARELEEAAQRFLEVSARRERGEDTEKQGDA